MATDFSNIELTLLEKLFNQAGYVLDFSNYTFDKFTHDSIGINVQELYGLSKGKSLASFWRASNIRKNTKIKLLTDLLEYYDLVYEGDKDSKTYGELVKRFNKKESIVPVKTPPPLNNNLKTYDVFISYAHEDKAYVDELEQVLKAWGISVWRDTNAVSWGDSLRQKIDEGLSQSKFGITVLSSIYLSKYWTSNELDGLFALENANGTKKILPIWHNVTQQEVVIKSPVIAGRLAKNSQNDDVISIARDLKNMI